MMLPAAPPRNSDGLDQDTVILATTSPSTPANSANVTLLGQVTEDSSNGPGLENDGNNTDDTDADTDDEAGIGSDTSEGSDPHISVPSDGQRPDGWTTGIYSTLKTLVTEAKGAASKPVVRFIKKYLRGTKLIFVVGQTGSGKSSLLREITGQDITVGTEEYQVCPAIIDGEQYLFIDTAGFGASDIGDVENFHDIVSCLDALAPFVTIAGLLFVYGGTQDRMYSHDLATTQWVKCFCGPKFYRHITIVTTKWDSLQEDDFREAWVRFTGVINDPTITDILNPGKRYHGGSVYHHGVIMDDANPGAPLRCLPKKTCTDERVKYARAMIRERYSANPDVKLQVVREMAAGVLWHQTESARVLQNSPLSIKLDVRDDFLRLTVIQHKKPADLGTKPKGRRTASALPPAPLPLAPLPLALPPSPWVEKPQRSWYSRFWDWIEKAKELAAFFHEQQKKAAENRGATQSRPTAWVGLVGTLRNWWSGPRKPQRDE